MDEVTIKQELQKYNVTDAAIAKLNTDYMALADVIDAIAEPCMKTDEGKSVLSCFHDELSEAINNLRGRAAAL